MGVFKIMLYSLYEPYYFLIIICFYIRFLQFFREPNTVYIIKRSFSDFFVIISYMNFGLLCFKNNKNG